MTSSGDSPGIDAYYRRLRWFLIALLLWFALVWPITAVIDFDYIWNKELGYMVGDLLILVPLILLTLYGLRRAKTWATLLVLVVLGALAYDATHFLVFLARTEPRGIPGLAFVVPIPVALGILLWLLRSQLAILLQGRA
jgi:hypothetical protein